MGGVSHGFQPGRVQDAGRGKEPSGIKGLAVEVCLAGGEWLAVREHPGKGGWGVESLLPLREKVAREA